MRFPLSKAYRAFPELDRFSDAECEGFVRLAKSQNRPATYLWTLVGVLVAGFSIPVGFALTMFIANVVAKRGGPSAGSNATLIAFAGILLSLIGGAMLGVITYERWLKRTILSRVRAHHCAACSYSLLGLPVIDGGIICPECGQRFDLAARGLSAADVLARPDQPDAG